MSVARRWKCGDKLNRAKVFETPRYNTVVTRDVYKDGIPAVIEYENVGSVKVWKHPEEREE
jgi:hypothetical protein